MRPPLLSTEESYAERRKLFKNIWETAVKMDSKDVAKPKLIRTQRVDSDEKGKKSLIRKKEKLKNLRHVCNKILDFCDKQEAEEFIFDEQQLGEAAAESTDDGETKANKKRKRKKIKTLYVPPTPSKIKYQHPSPPFNVRETRESSSPKNSKSTPNYARKNLISDFHFTTLNNKTSSDSVTDPTRKTKVHRKRRKAKKNKSKPISQYS